MNYWLIKSEPDEYGIADLVNEPDQTEHWDGVRNYQARNFMRDQMRLGDQAFFYHSNCKPPGIVGVVTVVRTGYPDFTAFDVADKHFDPKSDPENPRWFMVDVKHQCTFERMISLDEIKAHPQLVDMKLVQRGNRLSVMPVAKEHWDIINKLAGID